MDYNLNDPIIAQKLKIRISHKKPDTTPDTSERNCAFYKCKFEGCSKTFLRNSDRTRHSVSHMDKTRHPCHKCKKTYTRRDNLLSHIRNHHRQVTTQGTQTSFTLTNSIISLKMGHKRNAFNEQPIIPATLMEHIKTSIYNSKVATVAPNPVMGRPTNVCCEDKYLINTDIKEILSTLPPPLKKRKDDVPVVLSMPSLDELFTEKASYDILQEDLHRSESSEDDSGSARILEKLLALN